MKKMMMVFLAAVTMTSLLGGCSSENSGGMISGNISGLEPFTVVERPQVVLDMPTAKEGEYETPAYVSEPVYYEPEEDYPVYEDTEAWSDNHDTAPMPEQMFNEYDLVGYWVDDPTSETPMVMQFYMENGKLYYRYYEILLGNGYGFNLANEYTAFEYAVGEVTCLANQGNIYCLAYNNEVYVSFYYGFDGPDMMIEQEHGTTFYRFYGTLNAY